MPSVLLQVRNMVRIRNLACLLLLQIYFTNGQSEKSWSNILRDSTLKLLAEKEHHINSSLMVYYGPPGVPLLSNVIHIGDVEDIKEKWDTKDKIVRQYTNLTFYNLSSAYSLQYRINLAKQKVESILTVGRSQLQGFLSVSTPISSNSTSFNLTSSSSTRKPFALTLNTMLLYYDMSFQIQNGTVIFGETVVELPVFGTVKKELPSTEDIQNFESRKLLEAVSAKLHEEVKQKTNLDNVRSQIKYEIFKIYRAAFGKRFKKTMIRVFESKRMYSDILNMYHFADPVSSQADNLDICGRRCSHYNITIPSFALRVEEKNFDKNFGNISFIEDEVYLSGRLNFSSLQLVAKIDYHNKSQAENKTLTVEYQLEQLEFGFELVARLDTASVELGSSYVKPDLGQLKITLADDQAQPHDDRYIIISWVKNFLLRSTSYIRVNCERTYRHYVNGILADGRIVEEIFKTD